jgi:hypothetical protein
VGYWRQRHCDVDLPQMASEATTPRPLFDSEIVIGRLSKSETVWDIVR